MLLALLGLPLIVGIGNEVSAQTLATVQFTSDTLTYPEASGSGSTAVKQTGVEVIEKSSSSLNGTAALRPTDGTAVRGTDFNISEQPGDTFQAYDLQGSNASNFGIWTFPNTTDEPDKCFTWTLTKHADDPRFNLGSRTTTTVVIRDDDPTIVSLARMGSGAVTEGGKVEFTVTLGRALIAGETIDVPMSIGGTGVTTGDWSLALKSSATNTGVTLSDAGTTTPEVRFTNAGAQTATLELTATADGTAENAETFEIALGANSAFDANALDTNVGGGAGPHGTNNEFDVTVNNAGITPPANNAPTVDNNIPNQVATAGTAFSYAFPTNTFNDADGNTLTYSATKSDNNSLPSWLTFTPGTRTFSGTPQAADVGTLSVKVTANDGNSGTVSDTFDIVVRNTGTTTPVNPALVPGIVFDNAHLTWNEADGCTMSTDGTGPGPTYRLKLKTKPLGPVEVFIEDPDDNYRSNSVAKGRLSIDNTPPSVGEQGGAYEIHDDGTYSTHPLPKLDEDTVLRFTPGNWDTWQRVNVKVKCADHYTAQIPIKHRMYAGYIDKYTPDPVYPGYFGIIDKGWTVHVNVRESDPPIVVKHLPAAGQPVDVKEGGHLDFEITLSEAAFEHDSTLTVYLSARGGKAAGVKRRDGDAQSCGGPLDDCLIFTPSNRTQWVRLFAINPGRDELKVEIPQLRWGNLEHVRDWEMRWPVEVIQVGQDSPLQDERAGFETAEAQAPSCVSDTLLADVQEYAGETWRTSPGHVERWSRVLAAFGVDNPYSSNPMTVAEAQAQADRGLKRWVPVAPALECLANPPQEEPEQAEEQPATPATPEVSLSAGSAVDEGGNATFTVTANPAPQSDLTIAWTVAQSGEYLAAPGAGTRTVVLTAGAASTALSVGTVDDDANEADGSVSVTLGTGTGYTVATGKDSAAVAVRDNDEPVVVSITPGSGVTEGTSASFTVSASPVPAAPLDVTLTIDQSGDFAASGETGSQTVTVPVSGSVDVEVATADDSADESDGSITASVAAGTGYTVAAPPDNAASVAVSDNDATATGPTLSIADATMKENQRNGYFTVTLSEKVAWPVHVYYATRDSTPVSAVAGQDYLAWQRSWQLRARFQPGQTETQIHVRLYKDSHDEDPETFEMVLFDAAVNGPPEVSVSIADGVAVGTITD